MAMAFNEHAVHSAIHRIFTTLNYRDPYFSISTVMEKMYPEVDVVARDMRDHARIDIYSTPLPSGRRATIFYRERAHHSTQRFSIAHELAHWEFDCNRGQTIPDGRVCGPSVTGKPLSERRADYFASELLAPLWVLDGLVEFDIYPDRDDEDAIAQRDQRVQRLASKFNLSLACMSRRVFDLAEWRKISRGR
jgi:hypothetical protein